LIDPVTGRTYHEAFPSLMPSEDEPEVTARLVKRHDDEEANVRNRLAKYDFSDLPTRAVFPHVAHRLDANRAPAAVLAEAVAFVELEDALFEKRVITDVAKLPGLEYEIAELGKYRRKSVARLDAPGMVGDTREAPQWVDLLSLAAAAFEFQINVAPAHFPHSVSDERLDLAALGPGGKANYLGKMLHVDSPEPVDLQIALTLAPREPERDDEKPRLLALCGDGADALAAALAAAYPDVYAVAEPQELPPPGEDYEDDIEPNEAEPPKEETEEGEDEDANEKETPDEDPPGFELEAFPGARAAAAIARDGLCPVVWLDATEAAAFRAAGRHRRAPRRRGGRRARRDRRGRRDRKGFGADERPRGRVRRLASPAENRRFAERRRRRRDGRGGRGRRRASGTIGGRVG
jgi:hypothetical protein